METTNNNTEQENNLPTAWDFVEKHYPDYYSCDEIAYSDDLSKVINGEMQEGDNSMELWESTLEANNGNEQDAMKQIKESYEMIMFVIYEKAIENFIKQKGGL